MEQQGMGFEMAPPASGAIVKVIGVGGGGGNAVKYMLDRGVRGAELCCINTDLQALHGLGIEESRRLQIGADITRGLGAGANPDTGRRAALESKDRIVSLIQGADMVFITAGMGGGTGTGAAPVVASIARDFNILTVAVVTRPFAHENRSAIAQEGIEQLGRYVDSMITIPNDKLLQELGSNATLLGAFSRANDVLYWAVLGITDLIIQTGNINVDFADVCAVMQTMGKAVIGTGIASGRDRASQAAQLAIRSPLVEDVNLNSAQGLLVNITASEEMTLQEYSEMIELIKKDFAHQNAKIVVGWVVDSSMDDEVKVTVIATGVHDGAVQDSTPPRASPNSSPAAAVRRTDYVNVRELIGLQDKGT